MRGAGASRPLPRSEEGRFLTGRHPCGGLDDRRRPAGREASAGAVQPACQSGLRRKGQAGRAQDNSRLRSAGEGRGHVADPSPGRS